MPVKNKIQAIREMLGDDRVAFAKRIGVSRQTIPLWERGEVSVPMERYEQMSEITGMPVAYIMGLVPDPAFLSDQSKPVPVEYLALLHGQAVYINDSDLLYNWALVDVLTRELVFVDGFRIKMADISSHIYTVPPAFSVSLIGLGAPLDIDAVMAAQRVWVEPISHDQKLRAELKGWYTAKDRFVENEFGQRFYYDRYGAAWLAFSQNT